MLQKILIANRGEIALRVIRACKELGLQTVAVYSEIDEQSLHVQLADEAICIGKNESSESYLRPERIISAAEIANVDAIHPGYGFLSEKAEFAEQCESCNIRFIGPHSSAIAKMGDKALARQTVKQSKVPIIPGSEGVVTNETEALKIAKQIGFPVIVKAAAGGGGKGMRKIYSEAMFSREFNAAQTEAEKAFGNGSIYVEKYIEEPRHIEFQILADRQGRILHLGERDCSVQRRHQKLIEEAPSPFLRPDLRKKMGKAAIRVAEACKYENAGTIEFLVDKDGSFYFIEMNTRIQVEHGVTEEVTGIDLVKQQLLIAAGEPLNISQSDIKLRGSAIQCRINAEDPSRNFAPFPGTVDLYYPPGGYGVRVDSHLYGGYSIPPFYDSLISKLIAVGPTREAALKRMKRALSEYIIRGIKTTIPFSQGIIEDPTFIQGNATTHYIEEFMARNPRACEVKQQQKKKN